MNYKIIDDEQRLKEFIDWLPELRDNEKYYLSLFARKKYCQHLIKSNDKTQLRRFTSDKSRMFDKISQLEIPLGRWKLRDIPAPQESLVLYISVNPRDMKKACKALGKKTWDLMENQNFNIHAEALSAIQRSKSRSCWVDFDIDDKGIDLDIPWLQYRVGELNKNFKIMETRGGFHILVDPVAATEHCKLNNLKANWHQDMTSKYPVDQTGDRLTPVAGCLQGNFSPKFLS